MEGGSTNCNNLTQVVAHNFRVPIDFGLTNMTTGTKELTPRGSKNHQRPPRNRATTKASLVVGFISRLYPLLEGLSTTVPHSVYLATVCFVFWGSLFCRLLDLTVQKLPGIILIHVIRKFVSRQYF